MGTGTWYLFDDVNWYSTPYIGAHIPFWFNVVYFLRGREVLYAR